MNWNDTAYKDIVAKHAVLDGKPESVALAVWALTQKKDMTPEEWRALSKSSGVRVAGRAVGSARAILGLQPKNLRPKGPESGRATNSRRAERGSFGSVGAGSIADVLDSIRNVESERDRAVATLGKIRQLIDGAS